MRDEIKHTHDDCCTRNVELRYILDTLYPMLQSVTTVTPPACHRLIARNFIDCRVNVRRVTACENKGGRKEDLVIVQMMPFINTLYKTWFRSRSIVTAFSASARFLKANTHPKTLHTWTHGSTSRARTTSCMPRASCLLHHSPIHLVAAFGACGAAQRP